MITKNKRLTIIMLTATILLLIPFIAMQLTNEVNWTFFDFGIAAALLSGTGLFCELVLRKIKNRKYRILFCAGILAVLILIWLELAVGIFGTPFAGS